MSLRKTLSFVAVTAILALTLAGCAPALVGASVAPMGQAQAQPTAQPALPADAGIKVSGVGQVFGTPDIARVVVGVETQGSDVKQAVTDNNTKMTALINALKSAGIAAKDIQTTNYSVYVENPQGRDMPASDQPAQDTQSGLIYHVTNQVQITVRDITKLSSVLEQSVDSGANSIYGVSFDVSNPIALEDQAREMAVADAKARAEKLAKLQGLTLGDVIRVEEGSGGSMPFYGAAKDMAQGGGAPIEGGSIQVTVNLQVTYSIR
jgi:uncharacterized protein YggE